MNSHSETYVDLVAIEDEARQMRAEALRYGISRVRAMIASLFGGKGSVVGQTV